MGYENGVLGMENKNGETTNVKSGIGNQESGNGEWRLEDGNCRSLKGILKIRESLNVFHLYIFAI